jgi:mannosyltransferase OCH1-like enzyme
MTKRIRSDRVGADRHAPVPALGTASGAERLLVSVSRATRRLEDILAAVIPRIFHRVWVGSNPIPDEFAAYGEGWERLHPDWEMREWTEDNLPELLRPEGADPRRDPTERSDLLRYELVRRFGGVYLDMDFECLKPIDELIDGIDFFVGNIVSEQLGGEIVRQRVGSAIIGAVPGHPILERATREARPRADSATARTPPAPCSSTTCFRTSRTPRGSRSSCSTPRRRST